MTRNTTLTVRWHAQQDPEIIDDPTNVTLIVREAACARRCTATMEATVRAKMKELGLDERGLDAQPDPAD